MIHTLTLNPAIDKGVYLDGLVLDQVNRVSHACSNAGGKGINISRALSKMGTPSVAYSFAVGPEGEMLRLLSAQDGIETCLIETAAPTRINVKVVDTKQNTFTDLNEPGGPVTEEELALLVADLMERAAPGDLAALSGSIPRGLRPDTYAAITRMLREKDVLVAADCDGEALRHCVRACPDVIKPNNFELSALVGRELKTRDALISAAKELVEQGVGTVLITLGGDGALSVSGECVCHAAGLKVPVLSTVGAGDTFLAGYLKAMTLHEPPERALARAMSASTAKVQCQGTDMPEKPQLEQYLETVRVERL